MASAFSPMRASLGTSTSSRPRPSPVIAAPARAASALRASHKVDIAHQGKNIVLEVPDGETILSVALDNGIDLPHDCQLGVCMTCPAKLVRCTLMAKRGAAVAIAASLNGFYNNDRGSLLL